MSKIVRYEFMGNWWVVGLLCITGIGLPLAIVYLVYGTIRIESELGNPEEFVHEYRVGNLVTKPGPR
jgi:hypothetical protein